MSGEFDYLTNNSIFRKFLEDLCFLGEYESGTKEDVNLKQGGGKLSIIVNGPGATVKLIITSKDKT